MNTIRRKLFKGWRGVDQSESQPSSGMRRSQLLLGLLFGVGIGCVSNEPDQVESNSALQEEALGEGETPSDDEFVLEEDPGFVTGVGDYFGDRALDLLDVASARIIIGPGLRLNLRATELIQIGAGLTGSAADEERGYSMPAYFAGLQRRQGGVWKQRTSEAGISLFYSYDAVGRNIKGNKAAFGPADRGFFDVGFAAHAGLGGLEAEIRLDEAIDFVLGFFAIDFLGDDRNG